jgi:hypothetical protein
VMPSPRQIGYVYAHNGTDYLVIHTALMPDRCVDNAKWHVYQLGPHGFRLVSAAERRSECVIFIQKQ